MASSRRRLMVSMSAGALAAAMPRLALPDGAGQGFADRWEFKGVALQEPGYHVWCTSPIRSEDGRVHLFASRWPQQYKVDPGWRSHSAIAHYVGDKPEGPFGFVDVVLAGTGKETWDKYGMHNPAIHKVGRQYVLLYIANNDYHRPPHSSNQRIGMAVADSLNGPWVKVGAQGQVLAPSPNPDFWNYQSRNGVANPALLQYKGAFFLYFKSQGAKMGLAIAEQIAGPYVQYPVPVTSNNLRIEDGYAFVMDNKICLLTTDNEGTIKKGGGILWKSVDGVRFDSREAGFHLIDAYVDTSKLSPRWHYGPTDVMKFERPQLLLKEDGSPDYLYATSGCNIYGGDSTVSYVLKYRG